jgi:hypothetical protein
MNINSHWCKQKTPGNSRWPVWMERKPLRPHLWSLGTDYVNRGLGSGQEEGRKGWAFVLYFQKREPFVSHLYGCWASPSQKKACVSILLPALCGERMLGQNRAHGPPLRSSAMFHLVTHRTPALSFQPPYPFLFCIQSDNSNRPLWVFGV